MSKINYQKGAIEVSTIAAIIITAAIVAAVSIIATSKYYERLNVTVPIAVITPKITLNATPASRPVADVKTEDWQTYRNEEFGFTLTFPASWKNYRAVLSKDHTGTIISFELPTSDKDWNYGVDGGFFSVFVIQIFPINDWLVLYGNQSGHPKLSDIINNKYVFNFLIEPDDKIPQDLHGINAKEVTSTFVFAK